MEAAMRRILVVDDDLHTRLAIRAWLKQRGFNCRDFASSQKRTAALPHYGQRAIERLKANIAAGG